MSLIYLRYYRLLNGASTTVQVFALVLLFSIPLGLLIAPLPCIHWKPLHYLINIYIWVMRGTPFFLHYWFLSYVLSQVLGCLDRLPVQLLAFVLNYAAYFAEIFRGGIETLFQGQYEAAKVLKFSPFVTECAIILPLKTSRSFFSVSLMELSFWSNTSLVYALGISDPLSWLVEQLNRYACVWFMFSWQAIYLWF